jgi:DNA-binding CsgD family transcriptional regulator
VVSAAIVGRDEELRSLSTFLERTAGGLAAIVLEGEAGIGKSTLWLAGVEAGRERGFRVLCSRPAEAEQDLAHVCLGDLFEDALELVLPSLSGPRKRALEIALLLKEPAGRSVDPRTLGIAVRDAVEILAADGPVVLAVDDLQWLDRSSESALAFAVRRLAEQPVVLLLALRVGDGRDRRELARSIDAARVERIAVGPLSVGATQRLLHSRLGRMLGRAELLRLHDASGGNPFFSLELARALECLPRPPAAGEPLPVPAELEPLLARRLGGLPPRTIEVLRIAAALVRPTLGLVAAAAGRDVGAAFQPACETGVLTIDGEHVRFAHPLFSLAVASELEPHERRELHARLAGVVDDAEQRARHLALASEAPNEEIAAALEAAAEAAAARGGWAAAAELFDVAAARTPREAPQRSRRRLRAATFWSEVGDDGRALSLVEPLLAELPPGRERARALMQLSYLGRDLAEGVRRGEEALLESDVDDPLAAEIHNEQANQYSLLLDLESARLHAAAAVQRAARTADRGLLAQALAYHLDLEHVAGERIADELVEGLRGLEREAGERPYLHSPTSFAAVRLLRAGRLEAARALVEDFRRRAQEHGLDALDAHAALHLARLECLAGRLEEAERLTSDYGGFFDGPSGGRYISLGATGFVAAYAGRLEEARAALAEGADLAAREHYEFFRLRNLCALAFVDLSLGDARAVLDRLLPIVKLLDERGYRHPTVFPVLPEAIEAAIGVGELETARPLVDRLDDQAHALAEPWPLAIAARSRGLLGAATGDFDGSFEAFEQALGAHERMQMPFERARTLLALGAVQRRAKRRTAARESLQQALLIFADIGAPLWAAKARSELSRISGRRREQNLTPTERRVADLVAAGRTNKEVAAELFLGERTVASHLTHIYAKLGVRSRTELARALEQVTRAQRVKDPTF